MYSFFYLFFGTGQPAEYVFIHKDNVNQFTRRVSFFYVHLQNVALWYMGIEDWFTGQVWIFHAVHNMFIK